MASIRILLAAVVALVVCPPPISFAGDNPEAKLALHLLASSDSLGCAEIVPAVCDSIRTGIPANELTDTDGYGYVALIAYDVGGMSGVEFALDGWPTGRGAPVLSGPYWCEDALSLGDHEGGGGITAFQRCVEPGSNGMAILAYWSFGPLDSADLPISLSILPSTYSDDDSLLVVLDCTEDFVADPVVLASGCTIGGDYSGTDPDCGEGEDGGESGGDSDTRETPLVSFIGPGVQRARSSGCWVNLRGRHVDEETRVYLVSETGTRRAARRIFLGEGVYSYKAATDENDVGTWSVVISNGQGKTAILQDVLLLVSSLVKYRAARCGDDYLPGLVSVKLRNGIIELPANAESATPAEASVNSDAFQNVLATHSVLRIERTFKGRRPGQTMSTDINGNPVRLSDLSQFYQLRVPSNVDPADVATDLEIVPGVMQIWLSRPVAAFADTLEPNDYYYQLPEGNDSTQWALRKMGCPEAWARVTCSDDTILISIIEDTGVSYEHEDLGASSSPFAFPNDKVVGGYDFTGSGDPYPNATPGQSHGTKTSGLAAASTDNTAGIAGAGWDAKLLAYQYDSTPAQAARAIDSSRVDGAHIVNMSWGWFGCDTLCCQQEYVDVKAAVHDAAEAGVTLIAAGGNTVGQRPPCPAAYPEVIGVGSVGSSDYVVGSSTHGQHIRIVAPSGVITTCSDTDSAYAQCYGTSCAAPQVAGISALIQALADSLFGQYYCGEDISGLLCASADPAGSPAGDSYPNDYVGWGRVNVAKAMARLEEPYNQGEGPSLLSVAGCDQCHSDTSITFDADGNTTYVRHRCLKWAQFDAVYADSFAWGMHRNETNGAPPSPCGEDEMLWDFCEVVPYTIASWGCSLESYVYLRIVDSDTTEADTSWVPCHPDSLRWSYRVSGIELTSVCDEDSSTPQHSDLIQAFPNPFNPTITITFTTAERGRTALKIYDVSGRHIRTLLETLVDAGAYTVVWDGLGQSNVRLGSGVYFARLETPSAVEIRKIVLLR